MSYKKIIMIMIFLFAFGAISLKEEATWLILLGSVELGKELAIEAQRLGGGITVDRYPDTPAMQVAHRNH